MTETTCPFCSRSRLTATGITELLAHYRCDFCFKEWGEPRLTSSAAARGGIHDLPRWVTLREA